jgi:hypothetical protein
MKKLFTILFFTACFVQASSAQFGISAGALYGTGTKKLGFTGRVNYDFTSNIGVYVGYSALSSESSTDPVSGISSSASLTSIDIDGHYHFTEGPTRIYALAGLSLLSASVSVPLFGSISVGTTGINLGGGLLHNLSEKLGLFVEAKYVIYDGGQLVATAGVHYAF